MIPTIPSYITLIVVVGQVIIAVAVWKILTTAAGRSTLAPRTQQRFRVGAAAFLGAWLIGALWAAPAPDSISHRDPFTLTPVIPAFFLLSFAALAIVLWRSATVRHVLADASLPSLVGVQVYRVLGVVFVVLLAQDRLPAHFALPAGWGDIAVGSAAPLVAWALARRVARARAAAVAWNILGLLDLVVAVGMGTGRLAPLLLPQLGSRVPAAAAMGVFPMILVPTFAVPLAVVLHLVVLGRLRREVGAGERTRSEHLRPTSVGARA